MRPPVRRLLWRGFLRWFPVRARKRSVRGTYDGLAVRERALTFLNQGYLPLDPDEPVPVLDGADSSPQLYVNLYHQAARSIDLAGRAVLEVGSGQGGGSYYLHRGLGATVTGVDLSPANAALATRLYGGPGLTFREGDAEALPFPDGTFDAVVNIESSHLYPRPAVFFREAWRVLRSGGHLLFADLGERARMAALGEEFRQAGFEVRASRDITANVVGAIRANEELRTRVLRQVARDDQDFQTLAAWARMVGTPGYQAYLDGTDAYWSYVLRKA